jgi:hypothetical protein
MSACWDWFRRKGSEYIITRWNKNNNHFQNILLYNYIKLLLDVCTKEERSIFLLCILKLNTVYMFSNIFIFLSLYFPKMFTMLHTSIKLLFQWLNL